jgi:type II secretory pathway component GspD/PulD (secretin)
MKIFVIFSIILCFFAGSAFSQPEDLEMRVFELKHRDAASMQPVIEHLKSSEGKISIDYYSDSLIVVDYPGNLEKMAEVISLLDVPQKQVEIKVLIAEVTSTFLGRTGIVLGGDVISADEFGEISYLLNADKDINIRSEMAIKTLSGKPARFQVAREDIFWKTTIEPESGIATIEPVEREPVGNFLEVLPKVNNDGSITVTVRPSVSNVRTDYSVYERSILTQVIINSGDTIAIGGFRESKVYATRGRLPFTETSIAGGSEKAKQIVMFLTATISD